MAGADPPPHPHSREGEPRRTRSTKNLAHRTNLRSFSTGTHCCAPPATRAAKPSSAHLVSHIGFISLPLVSSTDGHYFSVFRWGGEMEEAVSPLSDARGGRLLGGAGPILK